MTGASAECAGRSTDVVSRRLASSMAVFRCLMPSGLVSDGRFGMTAMAASPRQASTSPGSPSRSCSALQPGLRENHQGGTG